MLGKRGLNALIDRRAAGLILAVVLVVFVIWVGVFGGPLQPGSAMSSPTAAPAASARGSASPTPAAGVALEWRALRNAVYPTSLQPGTVGLRDGVFEQPAAPGSASLVTVRLADFAAFGDLDGDGQPDAAVVLTTTGGPRERCVHRSCRGPE